MKIYNFTDLKRIAKEQDYKGAALENLQGEKIYPFNYPKTKDVFKQLIDIEKRLKTEVLPDGYYNVLMALRILDQKNPDKYTICKGSQKAAEIEPAPIQILQEKAPEVLTWKEALNLHAELAKLREENKSLLIENTTLKSEIENSLDDGTETEAVNLASLLKEHAPVLLTIADRFFNIEEKKLNLKEKELDLKQLIKAPAKQIQILPGTREHLILIQTYFNNKNQLELDKELEKLEAADTELFNKVINELNNVK